MSKIKGAIVVNSDRCKGCALCRLRWMRGVRHCVS